MSAPVPINNTVSRTCVPITARRGEFLALTKEMFKVRVWPRNVVPYDKCEPTPGASSCGVSAADAYIEYPAHELSADKRSVCFHWDDKLWGASPGRYVVTVYMCDTCLGCFQIQVGKRVDLGEPSNISFNPCDAVISTCTPDVSICK